MSSFPYLSTQQLSVRPGLDRALPPTAAAPKPRRQQVSRACEGCRVRRVKCDDARPCQNCQQRGDRCVARGSNEPRSLAQALREIDRLKQRIRQLEHDAEASRRAPSIPTSVSTSVSTSTPPEVATGLATPDSPSTHPPSPSPSPRSAWEGIFVASASSEQTSYYGPSSGFYFISRIGAYLAKTLHEPLLTRQLQPRGVNRSLVTPTDEHDAVDGHKPAEDRAAVGTGRSTKGRPACLALSRTLEEHFIGLFWDYYYYTLPILDERAFREHYASLWDGSTEKTRRNSALVDMVLALAIQYGYTFIPKSGARPDRQEQEEQQPGRDATIAGRWYYQRGKSLLAHDLESPSLSTLQCLVFSVSYLCCASFQNMAHLLLAQAVRVAQMLALHLEPPASMPRAERELRKRTWWVLYTIEAKTSMKLGRPFLMETRDMTVTLPSDEVGVADLHGTPRPVFEGGVTWLSYALQCQKLLRAGLHMHHAAWTRYGQIMEAAGQTGSPYASPTTLERCAAFLSTQTGGLQTWVAQVPAGLKIRRRRGGGRPFSVACDALDLGGDGTDAAAPPWLRRNRICLELLYHTVALSLYRPFISFGSPQRISSTTQAYTPMADAHAAACARHAAALVAVMHQAVTETELLRGWNEFFLWHWNATVTLIGFLLADPVHVLSALVRAAIDQGIAVCEVYGAHFAVASSAVAIARDLTARADGLIAQIQSEVVSLATLTSPVTDPVAEPGEGRNAAQELASDEGGLAWLEPSGTEDQGLDNFDAFMDWALTVDAFNSYEYFCEADLDGMLST